jgi:hypothetical protein
MCHRPDGYIALDRELDTVDKALARLQQVLLGLGNALEVTRGTGVRFAMAARNPGALSLGYEKWKPEAFTW